MRKSGQMGLFSAPAISRVTLILVISMIGAWAESEIPLPKSLEPFLEEHCFECHDDITAEADLDLYSLPFDLSSGHGFETWEHVFDKVRLGEMPPKKRDRPAKEDQEVFLKELRAFLLKSDREKVAKKGRVNGRRLTRVEYEHSLHDLLGVRIPLAEKLPADESEHAFETVAKAQQLSHFHLSRYMEVADEALREAFDRIANGDEKYVKNYQPKELTKQVNYRGANYRGPEPREGKVFSWNRSAAYNGIMERTRVSKAGWYRIRVKNLYGVNGGEDGVVWGTLSTNAGAASDPVNYLGGTIEATATPKDVVMDVWMKRGQLVEIKPNESGEKMIRYREDQEYYAGRDLVAEGFPGLVFDGITIQRIYPGGKSDRLRKILLPGIEFAGEKPVIEEPKKEISRLVTHFARRTFVRPVAGNQLAPYEEIAIEHYDKSGDFYEALHEAYRAILCSPRFLTFVEPVGPLDDFAIAKRLSYLFWSSVPDWELRQLAQKGELKKRKVLEQQIERLLNHPRSERFVVNFTDQWLDLKNINFTMPDKRRFRHFDAVLQESMLAETRQFIRELIDKDLGVRNFIRSDFAMLDQRLVRHYELKSTTVAPGKGMQKVTVKNQERSGLVTQGSILKVTADGSVTSPVLRGVWIGERILGLHIPPPPPNVPAIEPDIRGATSIRDELEKHRDSKSCRACHEKIDPQGYALESFDPTGKWRDFYGKSSKSAKVDPSGVTLEGREFSNIHQWKDIYEKRPQILAKTFTRQLITYGTGAPVRFSDRREVGEIVEETKGADYGLRSLIKNTVTSNIFLKK